MSHSTTEQPNVPVATETLAENTTIRYEGSIEEFRGCYGWVEAGYPYFGDIRYNIALSAGVHRPVERLSLVRRASLVVGENPA